MNKHDIERGAIPIGDLATALYEKLGLEPRRVRSTTIRSSPGPEAVTVEHFLLDSDGKKYLLNDGEPAVEILTFQVTTRE